MKIKITAIILALMLLLPIAACETPGGTPPGTPPAGQEELPWINADNFPRIDGSTANMPLIAAIYSRMLDISMDEAETLVQTSGGTGAVWRNMMWEGADMLIVYEAPEMIADEMRGMGILDALEITPIGRDGLVFLVNAQNPVDNLTREQLVGIFTGEITDWSEVGGQEGPIAAFQRNPESGSQTLLLALLMQGIEPMEPPMELRPGGMGALIDAVAAFDGAGGAIGFSVYYFANLMYENPNLKLLSVDGVAPSAQSIGDGSYPLVNEFFVVIRAAEPEDSPARILRDWLLTDEGRQLMLDAGYVPAF